MLVGNDETYAGCGQLEVLLVNVFMDQGSLGSCAIECWEAVGDVGTAGEVGDASYIC